MSIAGEVDLERASAIPTRALTRRALSLGTANAFDYAMQFLLPVVLARCLEPGAFGEYRLLWLAVMTVMAVTPLSMPQSLYFFVPRSDGPTRRLYVHQTMLYLAGAGLLAGMALSAWNPLLPQSVHPLTRFGPLVPELVAVWAVAYLLDLLPTIDERVSWQASIVIALSLIRVFGLAAAALFTGDVRDLILVLLCVAGIKLVVLTFYVAKFHGLGRPWLRWRAFTGQIRHAAPFGFSSALYALRVQADQWVAASLFALQSFAAFSIAAVLGPMINLFRVSVNHAFLPSMSRLQADGDLRGMLDLNSRANVMVAALAYPLLAFAFVFAEDVVSLIYTSAYLEAAPVMRVYIASLAAFVVEVVSIMLLLKEGAFSLRLNLLVFVLSAAMSWLGAHHFGLPGAAAGSTIAIYVDRIATLMRISKRTGIAFHRLQDWKTLGLLLLFASMAAVAARVVAYHFIAPDAVFTRLLVGGATLAATYTLLPPLLGHGRAWLLSHCLPGR